MNKKRFRKTLSSILFTLFAAIVSTVGCNAPSDLPITWETPQISAGETIDTLTSYRVDPLSMDAISNTQDGAVKYGAVIELGDLDEAGRSTYAHIRVSDAQEPGTNGEERNERIDVDPAGWFNRKENGEWLMNRCHLVGYQFSGLNNELRNLAPGTAYVNKGASGNGMDEGNPDGMLFYEQRLDTWLYENQDKSLDLYVRPIYGDSLIPEYFYMQWVGVSPEGEFLPIDIGGKANDLGDGIYGVLLQNVDQNGRNIGLE